MVKAKRHLHNSNWFLLGLILVSLAVVVLIFATDSLPKERGGRWVKDKRGVWISEGEPGQKPEPVRQQEFLIREAQLAFQVIKNTQSDISGGPCLGPIFHDWVADLTHTPRQPVDDDPKNQCEQYQRGEVEHFIELSLTGDVIRIE